MEKNTYNLYGLGLSKPLSPFFLFILAGSKPVGGMKRSRGAGLPGFPEGGGHYPAPAPPAPAPRSHGPGPGSPGAHVRPRRRRLRRQLAPQCRIPSAALAKLGSWRCSTQPPLNIAATRHPACHLWPPTSAEVRRRRKFWWVGGACAIQSDSVFAIQCIYSEWELLKLGKANINTYSVKKKKQQQIVIVWVEKSRKEKKGHLNFRGPKVWCMRIEKCGARFEMSQGLRVRNWGVSEARRAVPLVCCEQTPSTLWAPRDLSCYKICNSTRNTLTQTPEPSLGTADSVS